MKNFNDWRERQNHLPEFMRDFHDQKDLFKTLADLMENAPEEHKNYLSGLNFMNTQVFVIDYFLWIMAAHGYTLQRSKQKFDFGNIEQFMREAKDRRMKRHDEAMMAMLNEGARPGEWERKEDVR